MELQKSILQTVSWRFDDAVPLLIKRDDLLDEKVGGNKYRKLFGLLQWVERQTDLIVHTMGGPHSNHLAAMASVARTYGFSLVAWVRDTGERETPTLNFLSDQGTELRWIERGEYRKLRGELFSEYSLKGHKVFVPEGGSGKLSESGLKILADELIEQLTEYRSPLIVLAAGTGSTALGLWKNLPMHFELLVRPAGKRFGLHKVFGDRENRPVLSIVEEADLTVFGHLSTELWYWMEEFERRHRIVLDPLYTGPTMRYLLGRSLEEIEKYDAVVFYHSGGLQGREAYAQKLGLEI